MDDSSRSAPLYCPSLQVCQLWYRPPELIFGMTMYDSCVDMWGVGCIFAELILRRVLFEGASDVDQV